MIKLKVFHLVEGIKLAKLKGIYKGRVTGSTEDTLKF
ncbi:MAG: hypothetical protein JWP81_2492 [Ferruginibacter sp.]|nr:hypothetical protein [Ferruginibacter sp.]